MFADSSSSTAAAGQQQRTTIAQREGVGVCQLSSAVTSPRVPAPPQHSVCASLRCIVGKSRHRAHTESQREESGESPVCKKERKKTEPKGGMWGKERKKTDNPNEARGIGDEDRVPTCTSRILEDDQGDSWALLLLARDTTGSQRGARTTVESQLHWRSHLSGRDGSAPISTWSTWSAFISLTSISAANDRARYKGWLRALHARRPRRRRGTIDTSAIYPHTNK